MNEGPWTVVANTCATTTEMLCHLKAVSNAIDCMGAAVRMAQNECARVDARRAPIEEAVNAWRNTNDITEDALMTAQRCFAAVLEATLRTPLAQHVTEAED